MLQSWKKCPRCIFMCKLQHNSWRIGHLWPSVQENVYKCFLLVLDPNSVSTKQLLRGEITVSGISESYLCLQLNGKPVFMQLHFLIKNCKMLPKVILRKLLLFFFLVVVVIYFIKGFISYFFLCRCYRE